MTGADRAASSIVARFARAQTLAVAIVALLAVVTGGVAGGLTVVRREDQTSLALARVLRSEMLAHDGSPAALDEQIRAEVSEQRGFGRRSEVWRGRERLGGDGRPALVGPAPRRADACDGETLAGEGYRVCAVDVPGGAQVRVAMPLAPLRGTLFSIGGALALASLGSVLSFALVSRRVARRAVQPLARLQRAVAALDGARGDGRVGRAFGAAEVDELAATFDALLARIEEAAQRERRFLFDVSHELRTPLTRLRAQLDLARAELPAGDSALGERLRAAGATCEGLVRVTESVLALARSEVPAGEAVDVGDCVRGLRERLEPAQAARVEVDAPDEALVRVDPGLLDLAVGNLIDNALKFSSGSVRVVVRDAGEVTCAVEDRGPGVPEEDLGRVFEPFFRGREARSRKPGVGLGLALVRHVAGAYGGGVRVERREGGGLRAVIALPPWAATSRAGSAATPVAREG